ncbi:hypothetical protein TPHA_0F01910 [Tetrapisispora phaffii CBS 4417]|uniref:Mitochondrial import receptor subunit TOM22 n=1 Tax=Tetrapisispora phaffii (strain ATCC 24235 / CBS 4417 / NBRC 1672 / NRRL Y-8282 / UCD 70-5) TaxID=1071381 RepID=G8BV91_TETPH|nr:hypothetical protein TPHA_0F01910 [Tetrapisispora phaffii CBS 4417]CCE63673.1 hypothetical protein TPHA_0F01910 [Tetrapisispora phaffii CBS 4417]
MVELTEIKEENANVEVDGQSQPIVEDSIVNVTNKQESGELSDDEFDSDFDDDFNENETLLERLSALKDIVPPKQRNIVSNCYTKTTSIIKSIFAKTGSVTWALTTSALLLGVPLSLSILSEQQLIEMEKSFDLQKDANDILAQGDSQTNTNPLA